MAPSQRLAGMTCYLISDLHLAPERPQVTAAFAAFLEARRDAQALYILGDLFEFYIGDDDDGDLVAEVAGLLRAFSEAGPSLYLMHGNRDFLIGEAFAERVGGELLPDPTVHEVGGEPVLLMHGDSLCTRDEEYQRFRALARSPAWKSEILAKSLEERRAIAEHLRTASRDAGSRKAEDIMDVTPDEVERAMREAECTTLIHGHTHRPARHDEPAGTRWVLGDWETRGWYLRATERQIELIDFPINQ